MAGVNSLKVVLMIGLDLFLMRLGKITTPIKVV